MCVSSALPETTLFNESSITEAPPRPFICVLCPLSCGPVISGTCLWMRTASDRTPAIGRRGGRGSDALSELAAGKDYLVVFELYRLSGSITLQIDPSTHKKQNLVWLILRFISERQVCCLLRWMCREARTMMSYFLNHNEYKWPVYVDFTAHIVTPVRDLPKFCSTFSNAYLWCAHLSGLCGLGWLLWGLRLQHESYQELLRVGDHKSNSIYFQRTHFHFAGNYAVFVSDVRMRGQVTASWGLPELRYKPWDCSGFHLCCFSLYIMSCFTLFLLPPALIARLALISCTCVSLPCLLSVFCSVCGTSSCLRPLIHCGSPSGFSCIVKLVRFYQTLFFACSHFGFLCLLRLITGFGLCLPWHNVSIFLSLMHFSTLNPLCASRAYPSQCLCHIGLSLPLVCSNFRPLFTRLSSPWHLHLVVLFAAKTV